MFNSINKYRYIRPSHSGTSRVQGSLVVPNSIIVHVDEAKTKSVTQLTAKLERVKANYKIETNKYLKEHGIQEWDVQIEDYDDVLSELNSVPGISAYPNYIFKRGDFRAS